MSDYAPLASALGARQDGEVSSATARDLLITVLGEFVRPHGGVVWTQTLIETLALFGIEAQTARQAIARLGQDDWLTSEKVGRRTRWHLTERSSEILRAGAERIYGFGQEDRSWNRQWLLLLVRIPDAQRHLRYRLGVGLRWAGFGSLGQGNWISPWTEREDEVLRIFDDLEITDAAIFRSEQRPIGDEAALAKRAWDLAPVASEYEQFAGLTARSDIAIGADPADSAEALLRLVHAWRRFPFLDPGLPPELLPDDWPGKVAAQHFAHEHAALGPAATQWWCNLQRRFDP